MPRLITFDPPYNQDSTRTLDLPVHHLDSAISYVGQDHRQWYSLPVNPNQLDITRKRNGYRLDAQDPSQSYINSYERRTGASQPFIAPPTSTGQRAFIDYNSEGNF